MNHYIQIAGDVHADFSLFSGLLWNACLPLEDLEEDYTLHVIQLGDLGWFPRIGHIPTLQINIPERVKLYFIPGNHDMRDSIDREYGRYGESPIEISKNFYYAPFGSRLEINGLKFLFLGGAASPDKGLRTEGFDWCKEEIITEEDYQNLPRYVFSDKFNVVCSHTSPQFITKLFTSGYYKNFVDPSSIILEKIYKRMQAPNDWFFGHMHRRADWKEGKTYFHVLHEIKTIVKEDWKVNILTKKEED